MNMTHPKQDERIYQIQNTKGEWSDLRPDEVELYVNSNAVTRVKPVSGLTPHPEGERGGEVRKLSHGGKREGSGRPKGEETTTINFRVPKSRKEDIKNKVRIYLNNILHLSK